MGGDSCNSSSSSGDGEHCENDFLLSAAEKLGEDLEVTEGGIVEIVYREFVGGEREYGQSLYPRP
jgi:hypothetical protein